MIPVFPAASKDKAEVLLSAKSQSIAVAVDVMSPPGTMPTKVALPAASTFHVSDVPLISLPPPVEVNCNASPVPELVIVTASLVAWTPARVQVVLSI